jgi:hypothetical protein
MMHEYNRTIFISAWFLGIQIMMTLTLMIEIMTVLIAILLLIKCCPGKHSAISLFILGGTTVVSGKKS